MRAVQIDLLRAGNKIYTYAKMGRFIVIGFVYEPDLKYWRGTKVHASSGFVEPRKYVLPDFFGKYLNEKAEKLGESLNSMSPTQQAKVEKAIEANMEKYIESDAFEAILADIEFFGDDALTKR